MSHIRTEARLAHPRRERGMALITGLLLLLVVTIIAMSMFRSFGMQEKIAGNTREKDRALNAAISAQQYAESWLLSGSAVGRAWPLCAPGWRREPARSIGSSNSTASQTRLSGSHSTQRQRRLC